MWFLSFRFANKVVSPRLGSYTRDPDMEVEVPNDLKELHFKTRIGNNDTVFLYRLDIVSKNRTDTIMPINHKVEGESEKLTLKSN